MLQLIAEESGSNAGHRFRCLLFLFVFDSVRRRTARHSGPAERRTYPYPMPYTNELRIGIVLQAPLDDVRHSSTRDHAVVEKAHLEGAGRFHTR